MLYPQTSPRSLLQSVSDIATVDADIFQIPVAEVTQSNKTSLALAMGDRGRNPAVEKAPDARQKDGHSSSDRWCSVTWGSVEHCHGFSFRRGQRSKRFALLLGSACAFPRPKAFRELRFILQMGVRCA